MTELVLELLTMADSIEKRRQREQKDALVDLVGLKYDASGYPPNNTGKALARFKALFKNWSYESHWSSERRSGFSPLLVIPVTLLVTLLLFFILV